MESLPKKPTGTTLLQFCINASGIDAILQALLKYVNHFTGLLPGAFGLALPY